MSAPRSDEPLIERRVGQGGELHQEHLRPGAAQALTTNHGLVVTDNQNSLRQGAEGPTLLEDSVLREKIFHFDHERIPERIVHARGSGAHGFFECTDAVPDLTCAHVFGEVGRRTPVFARFSTVAGGSGSADTPRDVRGFAVKFYTEEGNWDLVGNNIPVFFIQDAMKFPDLVHAVKMEADRGYPQAASAHDTFWDFVSLLHETTHMVLWAMSDRTLPRSLRMMQGFGVHTYRLVDADGVARFVKFHWNPVLGVQSTLWDEAVKIAGADPDFHRRDLYESIASGAYPEWELGLQVFDQDFADSLPWDVLDATTLIPEELLPTRVVGRMVLNRNPGNFFAETEQVAFLPSNLVPGIDVSDDPLLQGRLFSYLDTQKSRLGTTNFHQIPVNAPRCPVANFQRDGMMQTHVPTGRANYEPNSLRDAGEDDGPRQSPTGFSTHPGDQLGGPKHRVRRASFADHFSQPRMFWNSLDMVEQAHVASALVCELGKLGLDHVRDRMLGVLGAVDRDLALRVADGLGVDCPEAVIPALPVVAIDPSPAVALRARWRETLEGRKVAVLIADGSSKRKLQTTRSALERAGATVAVVAPTRVVRSAGSVLSADERLEAAPSVLFDAIALVLSPDAATALCEDSVAVQFVRDAFVHLKAIGCNADADALLRRAGVERGEPGVVDLADLPTAGGIRFWGREPTVRTLA